MQNIKNIFIYGRKPILEALQQRPDEIEKIFIKNSIQPSTITEITDLISENLIPTSKVPQVKIENLVGRVNDQGFVALMSIVKYANFFDWIETLDQSNNPAVLLLDGIEDPHNFGAILRTAAASGISAVLVSGQGQAPINATVFKTSAGTAGRIPIIRVHDSNQGLKDLTAAGFEVVALSGEATKTVWEKDFDKPVAFLIGNEGRGIEKNILKKCSDSVTLPMTNDVESLNASVSAALVCYEWRRRQS